MVKLTLVSIEGETSLRTVGLPTVRSGWSGLLLSGCTYNYGTFCKVRKALSKSVSPHLHTRYKDLTAVRTTANRARLGEFAVVPWELSGRILAKISRGNLFWRTLTEPRAPQMTWLWNWSSRGMRNVMYVCCLNFVHGCEP